MKYIIFDMEWNQPSKPEEKNPALLHGEIIQIGYFVSDEDFNILFREELTIKPVCYPTMNRYVSALTGITQKMAENGMLLSTALEKMAAHFDGEAYLFTWGDDDMPILRENMKYHAIDGITLPEHYNLQRLFCAQTNIPLRQIGLKTAAENFGLDIDIQAHDALNDAYLTYLIAKKLDIPKGIAEYSSYQASSLKNPDVSSVQPWLNEISLLEIIADFKGTIDSMASFCRAMKPICPVCKCELNIGRLCRFGKDSFITSASCKDGGIYFLNFSMLDDSVRLRIYNMNSKLERAYKTKLRKKEKQQKYREACKQKKRKNNASSTEKNKCS